MTTLEPISELAVQKGFRNFSDYFVAQTKQHGRTLARVVRCDDFTATFSLSGKSEKEIADVKWFVKLHAGQSTLLCFASTEVMKLLARQCGLDATKLDVLMFDGRLVFGLLNRADTCELMKWDDDGREMCALYAVDQHSQILKYRDYFTKLINHCRTDTLAESGVVFDMLRKNGWAKEYNIAEPRIVVPAGR